MKKLYLLAFWLFIMNVSVLGQTQSGEVELMDNSRDWKTLVHEKYEIEYPETWDIDTSGELGPSFFLFSKLSNQNDQFRDNVNLLIQDLSGYNLSLDQYVEISVKQVETLATDSHLILNERKKDQKVEFQKCIYTARQGIFHLKFEQYYWVINDKAYVLTLTCEEKEFDKYQTTGEKILNSFKLK